MGFEIAGKISILKDEVFIFGDFYEDLKTFDK